MQVSVVVCTYDPALFEDFCDAADSVLAQSYGDVELVAVVDGDESLAARVRDEYGDDPRAVVHCNDENRGLSASRNEGVRLASGDVVAFLDDDAVADEDWVAELVATFHRHDADAAGGRMVPRWVAGKPGFLPAEFYWLIGVTHRGFPAEECEVRNTWGSNIAFRREVFDDVGGFEPELGRFGDRQVQGEETELAARVHEERGERVWYNPDAVVEHKIFEQRTRPGWLARRAFWQGYSKYVMRRFVATDGDGAEGAFLRDLALTYGPRRLRNLVTEPSRERAAQLAWLVILTACVGTGFLWGGVQDLLE